jgi:hypothetical protein
MLILLGCAAILELSVHLASRNHTLRSALAVVTLIISGLATGALAVLEPHIFGLLFAALGVYRIVNMVRVVQGRMHDRYLRVATRMTTVALMTLQLVILGAWWAWETWHTTGHMAWAMLAIAQAAVAAVFLFSTQRSLKRTAWPTKHANYSDKELPSVTVAIPARNETEDLQQCLQNIIASDYPKLEIIVLDDCSQMRRTPEIIREFAQDGVRFVQGNEPSETWLPKNEAYARLAEEASGAYILFCGVDVRFAPHSIRSMVTTMLDRNKQMLSVLPRKKREAYGHFSLIQAMRYWWELAPPRRAFRRPPVLSSCWIISEQALTKAGGFAAVARAIVPEAHFARQLVKTDAYSFLRSGGNPGIESTKGAEEQRITAMRMRYPQVHRRPEQVVMLSLWEIVFLVAPFALAVSGFWVDIGLVAHAIAALASLTLIITYMLVVVNTHVNTWWFGLVAQPLASLADIAMLHYSMWKYEFSTVDWKGRNVCIPVMHVVPHLPTTDRPKKP